MCLPKICIALANEEKEKKDYNKEQAYHILAEMLEQWLAGKDNNNAMLGTPYFMSWNKLMEYPRFSEAYYSFTASEPEEGESNILNEAAKESLANYLCQHGYMRPGETLPFDFIGTKENWRDWKEDYHTLYAVPYQPKLDYTMITLGAFTLRALAKGIVSWKEGNTYEVHVTEIAVILWDPFQFDKPNTTSGELLERLVGLGSWHCDPPAMCPIWQPGLTQLSNVDMQAFKQSYPHGDDFMVLTAPHYVETFTEKRYSYECSKGNQ